MVQMHNRKRYVTPFHRRQIIEERRDVEREENIARLPVREGPAEALVGLLQQKIAMGASSSELLELGLQLQQVLRGDASLLSNQNDPEVIRELNRVREQTRAEDEALESFNKDRENFLQHVQDEADKMMKGQDRDKLIAQGSAMFQDAVKVSRAKKANHHLRLLDLAKNGPQVTINVAGVLETVKESGAIISRMMPEIIIIEGLRWVLPPGTHKVPRFVAERYQQILESREATNARQAQLLASNSQRSDVVEVNLAKIDRKYGDPSQHPPTMGSVGR